MFSSARLAQSAERKALNLVVVGSSPTVGVLMLRTEWPFTKRWQSILPHNSNLKLPILAFDVVANNLKELIGRDWNNEVLMLRKTNNLAGFFPYGNMAQS